MEVRKMKYLIFCCLSIFIFMACGGKTHDVIGYWSMEFEGEVDSYSIVLSDDTICSSELCFRRDTIYMEIKKDGRIVKNEFLAKYIVKEDEFILIDRYGVKKKFYFEIVSDVMIVRDKSEPDKILMRLRRVSK